MADISFRDVVGDKTVEDGGYAGDLLALSMAHLEKAKTDGTLTEAQVGEVYANTINNAFDKAIQFALNKELREVEIDNSILQGDDLVQKTELQAELGEKDSKLKDLAIIEGSKNTERLDDDNRRREEEHTTKLELDSELGDKDSKLKDLAIVEGSKNTDRLDSDDRRKEEAHTLRLELDAEVATKDNEIKDLAIIEGSKNTERLDDDNRRKEEEHIIKLELDSEIGANEVKLREVDIVEKAKATGRLDDENKRKEEIHVIQVAGAEQKNSIDGDIGINEVKLREIDVVEKAKATGRLDDDNKRKEEAHTIRLELDSEIGANEVKLREIAVIEKAKATGRLDDDNRRKENVHTVQIEGAQQKNNIDSEIGSNEVKLREIAVIEKAKNTTRLDDDSKRKANLHELQLTSVALQNDKATVDVENQESIIKAREEQVIDQRYIKTIEKVGGMLGATMNGGLLPDKGMLETFFTYTAKLNGIRTVYMGAKDMSSDRDTLVPADNTGISYPYGGTQTNNPDARNDFMANYYVVTTGTEITTDGDGNDTTTSTSASGDDAGEVTAVWEVGDLIMQSGTPDTPKWTRVQNKITEQEGL